MEQKQNAVTGSNKFKQNVQRFGLVTAMRM